MQGRSSWTFGRCSCTLFDLAEQKWALFVVCAHSTSLFAFLHVSGSLMCTNVQQMISDRHQFGCRVAGWPQALLQGRSLQRLARSCSCGCGMQRLDLRGLQHHLSASRLQGCQPSWQPASLSRQACKPKGFPLPPLRAAGLA